MGRTENGGRDQDPSEERESREDAGTPAVESAEEAGGEEAGAGGRPPAAAPEDPAAALEGTRKKLRDVNDRLLRTAADFDNFRKRAQREKEQYVARAGESVVRDLLPVLDNFHRALAARSATADLGALLSGVEMIYKQLGDVLTKQGVEAFDSVGQRFDPALHEAIQQARAPDQAPGTIVSEFARGYKMGGKLLRPALVVVADQNSGSALPDATEGGGGSEGSDGGGGSGGSAAAPPDDGGPT